MPTARRSSAKLQIDGIQSKPPSGKKKVLNIWYDNETEEFVFDIED